MRRSFNIVLIEGERVSDNHEILLQVSGSSSTKLQHTYFRTLSCQTNTLLRLWVHNPP